MLLDLTLALRGAQHSNVLPLALRSSINVHLLQRFHLMERIQCCTLNECNDGQRLHQHMQRGPAEVWYRECAILSQRAGSL